jgi:hypothetical protein
VVVTEAVRDGLPNVSVETGGVDQDDRWARLAPGVEMEALVIDGDVLVLRDRGRNVGPICKHV